MNEDPVISGAVVKVALVVLVAGALGAGAYALAGGGIDVDLPDLPDLETLGEESSTTTLQDTELSDTTIDGAAPAAGPFTSAGLAAALSEVRAEAGAGRRLTRLFINEVQTQFIVRAGADGVEAYSVRADSGELVRQEATISISGNASLADFEFALDAVDPAAVDRMLASARDQSSAAGFRPTVLSLERSIPFGSRELEWTINAQGGGRNLLFRADPEGRRVRNEGGAGSPVPSAVTDADALTKCIEAAAQDPEKIFECLDDAG